MPHPSADPSRDSVLRALMQDRRLLLCEALRIVGSLDRAEDVVQDAALRCLTSASVAAAEQPLRYARRMVRNLALDRLRRDRNHAACADIETAPPECPALDPEARLAGKQALEAVTSRLAELPERNRDAFLRHRLGDESQKQLAAAFCLSPARVNALIAQTHSQAHAAALPHRVG